MSSQAAAGNKLSVLKLLCIYLLTNVGSSLTTVVAFVSVEGFLQTSQSVNNALAVRTLGFVVFSYFTPALLNHLGEKKSLLVAQAFGLFALFILSIGFQQQSAFLIYSGIILTGLPGVLTGAAMIASLRNLTPEADQFRVYSSNRELIAAFSLCFAGFSVPLLLSYFNIFQLFIFDSVTYLIAIVLLYLVKLPTHEKNIDAAIFPKINILLRKDVGTFFLVVSGSLVLAATLPLIASSETIRQAVGLNGIYFKSMWGVEGLVGIFASYLYPKIRKNKIAMGLCYLNALPLIVLPYISYMPLQMLLLAVVPIGFSIVFFDSRDTLIISAKDDKNLMNNYIAISTLGKAAWGTISPYIVTGMFKSLGILVTGAVVGFVQIIELGSRRKHSK